MRFGMAVVKMPVTSVERQPLCGSEVAWFKSRRQECRSSVTALRSSNSIAWFPANHCTIRGEDRCYFVCETTSRPVGAGVSAIARSRIVSLMPVVKSAVASSPDH